MHICIYVYMLICIDIFIFIYVYIYLCIYMFTHIHPFRMMLSVPEFKPFDEDKNYEKKLKYIQNFNLEVLRLFGSVKKGNIHRYKVNGRVINSRSKTLSLPTVGNTAPNDNNNNSSNNDNNNNNNNDNSSNNDNDNNNNSNDNDDKRGSNDRDLNDKNGIENQCKNGSLLDFIAFYSEEGFGMK
jgi:hypothetical protein